MIGFTLRIINLHDNFFFGYDQARDMQRIYDIIYSHDLKMVGPETDIPGVFNGPLLYYLLLPAYLLSHFDPNAGVILLVLINLLGAVLVYLAGKTLFNPKVALLAGFFWAISYLQVNYGRYLSNTGLMPVFTLLFFYGLALYVVRKKTIGLMISVIGLALSIHVAFYFIYLGLFYLIYFRPLKPKVLATNILVGGLLLLPFIVAELKFRFLGMRSLFEYFLGQTKPAMVSAQLSHYVQNLSASIYNSFFSLNLFLAFFIFVLLALYVYQKKKSQEVSFLFVWLFSTLPLFAFQSGVVNGASIHSSMLGALTLLVSLAIYFLYKEKRYLFAVGLFLMIIVSNLFLFAKENFISGRIFAYQYMFYGQEKDLIDYTYREAKGKPFSICALTNPLFINTLWSALYKFYGEKTYRYLPFWSGQEQYQNKTFLPYDKKQEIRYLILEPPTGIQPVAVKATIYLEDQVSTVYEVKKFGNLEVQKRLWNKDQTVRNDSQNLSPGEKAEIESIVAQDPRYLCH